MVHYSYVPDLPVEERPDGAVEKPLIYHRPGQDQRAIECPGHLHREVGPFFLFHPTKEQQSLTTTRLEGERLHIDAIVDRVAACSSLPPKLTSQEFADGRNPDVGMLADKPF